MKRTLLAGCLITFSLSGLCRPGSAQEITSRFRVWRFKKSLPAPSRHDRPSVLKPFWRSLAQTLPSDPTAPTSPESAPTGVTAAPLEKAREKRAVVVYADASYGFDRKTTVIADPIPREVRNRRTFRVLNVTGELPVGSGVRLIVGLPYISQTESVTGVSSRRGSGIGDMTILVERQFRESGNGVQASAALGLVVPTGQDPFTPGQLATGNGFYQPFVRATVRKLIVPLQVYGSVNYGQGLPRKVNGQTLHQPASFGGEVGMAYAISPEFTANTSVNASQSSSPFLDGAGTHAAYLSQSLMYASGDRNTVRLAVDAGLTDDSLDAYFTLSLRRQF